MELPDRLVVSYEFASVEIVVFLIEKWSMLGMHLCCESTREAFAWDYHFIQKL